MKALTLWQPWASLVALGVKTIETRSWSTSYRGPLAIHAAKKTVYGPVGDYYAETWYSGVVHDNFRCYCEADGVGPPCTRGADRAPCLTKRERLVTMLPLGAVVATCTLIDVIPTDSTEWGRPVMGRPFNQTFVPDDQRPYGDFSYGRYAWLLADIEPLAEPVPTKGWQRLWELAS